MRASLILACVGFAVGGIVRPMVDDAMFYHSETCARSPVPVHGRYPAFTWDCRLADAWTYGTFETYASADADY